MISLDFLLLKFWGAEAEWTTQVKTYLVQWYSLYWIGLIRVKEKGSTGFSKGCQGCSKGFSVGEGQGKSQGTALLHEENPVILDYFTQIKIIFQIGFFLWSFPKLWTYLEQNQFFGKSIRATFDKKKISNLGTTFFLKNCVRNIFAIVCLLKDILK